MTTRLALFGTDAPPVASRVLTAGPLSFTYENGALRHIRWRDTEVLRGIAFLVRDRDWGTLSPDMTNETMTQRDGRLRLTYDARFVSGAAALDVSVTITADRHGLTVAADGRATGAFETNRAGFTVLHPINGVAGGPVSVEHGDGSTTRSTFPELIAPWQPFMDIAALTHQADGLSVTCRFAGDTFEMEDQRQWGDASFKTYNRPLALPWPYAIADGARLAQSVRLTWAETSATVPVIVATVPPETRFPELALLLSPKDAVRLTAHPGDIDTVRPQRLLCHLDATLGAVPEQFSAFARLQQTLPDLIYDLELICGFDLDPEAELMALSDMMQTAGFRPGSVFICPSVDRQSTPPGSDWPACPPLQVIHSASATAFPDVLRGGGMVSLFTELNRKRPPVELLDFVSHGLCPIVHAADDTSVIETLEAIPHITRSARAIFGDRPYRLGPCTIAMRQNPYGSQTIPNPGQDRICMTDDDPRHRAQFGAAYAIGLATALAAANIAVWAPSALYGPRGLRDGGAEYPIAQALMVLSRLAGKPVQSATLTNGLARLEVGETIITANLGAEPTAELGPYGWCHLTPE